MSQKHHAKSSRDRNVAAEPALDHFCNHQTHHRGQVHCLLTAHAGNGPSLDLILFQRESGLGARANT